MIILSDGGDNGSDETLASAIEAAQRADTIIYSILFSDATYYGGFGDPDGKNYMQRLAKETGGGYFEVSKKLTINQIYGIIEQELRSQYNLGFVSDQPVRISEFRNAAIDGEAQGSSSAGAAPLLGAALAAALAAMRSREDSCNQQSMRTA
jgi:VWFA-related protein